MKEKSFSIIFLLGYNPTIGGCYPNTPHEEIKEVWGEFDSMRIKISRLGEKVFQINIVAKGVPTAQQDTMIIDDTVAGMIGDTLFLSYGRKIQIVEYTSKGLEIKFIE